MVAIRVEGMRTHPAVELVGAVKILQQVCLLTESKYCLSRQTKYNLKGILVISSVVCNHYSD